MLPQAALSDIIATYKAWSDANVLKNALGPAASLNALWSKLDQTLIQIKKLSEEMILMKEPKHKASLQQNQVTTFQSSTQGQPCSASIKSPRRKRPHPQRNMRTTTETPATSKAIPPPEPEISHILDSFLSDAALTERLADIINKCVERPGGEVELSSSTLDHILDITCTEPAFEGVLKTAEITPLVSMAGKDEAMLEPPAKVQRGDQSAHVFPCSMDVDSFLDKVHASYN